MDNGPRQESRSHLGRTKRTVGNASATTEPASGWFTIDPSGLNPLELYYQVRVRRKRKEAANVCVLILAVGNEKKTYPPQKLGNINGYRGTLIVLWMLPYVSHCTWLVCLGRWSVGFSKIARYRITDYITPHGRFFPLLSLVVCVPTLKLYPHYLQLWRKRMRV